MCQNLVLRPTFKMTWFCLQHSAAGPRCIQWAEWQRNRGVNRGLNSSASWSPSRWISPCQSSHLTLCSSSLYTCTRSILAVQSKKKREQTSEVRLKWSETESCLVPDQLYWNVSAPTEATADKPDSQCVTVHAHTAISAFQYAVQPIRWLCCRLILSYTDVDHLTIPAWMHK